MTLDIRAAVEALHSGEEAARRESVAELGSAGVREAVRPLLGALGDESWPVRQDALRQLQAFSREALLPELDAALRDHEDAVARNAAMEVYAARSEVEPLHELLRDADEEIRHFAAGMLGNIGSRASTDVLTRALDEDTDPNVRHSAAVALGQIGAATAVPHLIQALRQEPWLQYATIGALCQIGDTRAVPAMVELLDETLFTVPALEALGAMADRGVLGAVIPRLSDPDPAVRNEAIRTVASIEQRATAEGASLDPGVQQALRHGDLAEHLLGMLEDDDLDNRRTATITLGWLREARAEAPLIRLLGDPQLHEYATHALVAIGFHDRGAWEHGLEDATDGIRQGCVRCLAWIAPPVGIDLVAPMIHDPSAEVRAEAADAIGRLGDEDAAMLLFELLADENELIQEAAEEALARSNPQHVKPLLLRALESDDEQVRIRGAETLGRIGDTDAAGPLVALAKDPREHVRRAALKALGELAGEGASRVMLDALRDASSMVRQQAVVSLGLLQDPETVEALLPLLEESDPRLRFVTLRALGQIRRPDVVPSLLPFLSDGRKELRFAAVEALGAIRAPTAVAPLIGVLGDTDRNLRRTAAEGLGAIAAPEAVAPLLAALRDEHWSVRCAVAGALGRIRSAKATPSLLPLLEDEDATVRRAVVAALGEIGDAKSTRRLLDVLEDPHLETTALESLRRMGPAILVEIERAYPTLGAPARLRLVDVIARHEDRRAGRLLLGALLDDSAEVRCEAALALGDGGFVEAARALTDFKASDPSSRVRKAASRALARLAPR